MNTTGTLNRRLFVAKYLSPTPTLGTRFKIVDLRHEKSVVYSWDYSLGWLKEQAWSIFSQLEIPVEGYSIPSDSSNLIYFFTSDFSTILKKVKTEN